MYLLNDVLEDKLDGNRTLLTTRYGSWVILTEDDVKALRSGKADEELLQKLEEAGIILTERNIRSELEKIVRRFGYLYNMPFLNVQINLTLRCNLLCKYCHANSSPSSRLEMDRDILLDVVRFLERLPKTYISLEFQGGEPFLKFDLMEELVERVRNEVKDKKVVETVVISNGTVIDKDIARWVAKNNVSVSVSLDGPKEMHDSQRVYPNGKGTYEDVLHAITLLRDAGGFPTSTATITKNTVKLGGAERVIEEYVKRGFPFIFYRPIMDAGRGEDNEELALRAEEFFEFVKGSIEKVVQLKREGVVFRDKFVEKFLQNIFGKGTRSYSCLRDVCGAGITQLVVAPDGWLYPCDVMKVLPEFRVGRLENQYEEVMMNVLNSMMVLPDISAECPSCPYIAFCGFCKRWNYGISRSLLPYHFLSEDCKFKKMFFKYIFQNLKFFRKNVDCFVVEEGVRYD